MKKKSPADQLRARGFVVYRRSARARSAAAKKAAATKKEQAKKPKLRPAEVDEVILFAAAEGRAASAFEPLNGWPVRGTVAWSWVWKPNDRPEPIATGTDTYQFPVVGESFSQALMREARARIERLYEEHPEVSREQSPALGVTRLAVRAGDAPQ